MTQCLHSCVLMRRKCLHILFDDYRSYCDNDPLGDLYPERYSYKYPLAGFPNSVVSVHAYNVDNRVTKNGLADNRYRLCAFT